MGLDDFNPTAPPARLSMKEFQSLLNDNGPRWVMENDGGDFYLTVQQLRLVRNDGSRRQSKC